jgi:hypothetical protein
MSDSDGYPTDDELDRIRTWDMTQGDPWELLTYIASLWHWYPRGWTEDKQGDTLDIKIATGGWSGNESVISAMRENYIFWGSAWVDSKRGGYYHFRLRRRAEGKGISYADD